MAYFFLLNSFIRPKAKKRSHTKKGSFMQCIMGGPPMVWIPPSQWMKGGVRGTSSKWRFKQKEKGQTISYWKIWLKEEKLFMWSHFTTIWNARNFDWWKPVHEDSLFSYEQFPSFGKHLVSQQMNIFLH
jgi:hypothetical protein